MKILMTADTVGGVWSYAVQLTQLLAKNGAQVLVATMGPRPKEQQRLQIAAICGATLCESDFRLEWMADPWDDVRKAGDWLLDLETTFEPDVVHLNGYAHGTLPWKAPTLMVAHSCVLSWWQAVKGEEAPAEPWATYRERVTDGFHAAECVVAPTKFMLGCVRDLYGRTREAHVIPNGSDPELFSHAQRKEPFVVSAGRLWDAAKNIAALDRIADEVRWPICMAGSATAPDGESKIEPSKICLFLGQLDQRAFAEFLGRAAIFCLPARYEPFGLCALEAAFSGCALVLGDIPSLREIWDGAAVFVKPEDDDELIAALNRLIDDPHRRTLLARRAHERAQSFTAARTAEEYLALYRKLVRSPINAEGMRASACAS